MQGKNNNSKIDLKNEQILSQSYNKLWIVFP